MNPFIWQGPSQIAESLKPYRMARTQSQLQPRRLIKSAETEILRDRHGGAYSKAKPQEARHVL